MKKIYSIILALFIIFAIIFFYKTSEANKNFDPASFIKTSNDYSYQINTVISGVPHIYGASEKEPAFGIGFPQTENE